MIPHFKPMLKLIGFFVYPDFQVLDAAGPIAAFEIANETAPDAYELRFLSIDGQPTRSSSGLIMETVAVDDGPMLHTLIVVGGRGRKMVEECPRTIGSLRQLAGQTSRVCSICSGAFVLASAGLLAKRRVTTHWSLAAELQSRYETMRVEADRVYVRDGIYWTSAGVSAGIDLALALISEDLGDSVGRQVARKMVVYYRRPGGQSQFSILAELGGDETAFSRLLEWMRVNLSEHLTVEQLADRASMSPRNFARQFRDATGLTPAKAVERLRLEVARERVEDTREPIEKIALHCGFVDPERMRRSFVRAFGQPPQGLRRAHR